MRFLISFVVAVFLVRLQGSSNISPFPHSTTILYPGKQSSLFDLFVRLFVNESLLDLCPAVHNVSLAPQHLRLARTHLLKDVHEHFSSTMSSPNSSVPYHLQQVMKDLKLPSPSLYAQPLLQTVRHTPPSPSVFVSLCLIQLCLTPFARAVPRPGLTIAWPEYI